MSFLQARVFAKQWFELAIKQNKLAYFVIGLPPYAEHRTDGGEIPLPVLNPNMEILYAHCEKNRDAHFDADVQNAVLQIVEEKGAQAYVILHVLIFVMTHLAYEKRGAARLALDCPRILEAVRMQLTNSEKKLSEENGSAELWDLIEYYDHLLRKQLN